MDIQKVIQLGQLDKPHNLFYYYTTTTWVYTICISMVILLLLVAIFVNTKSFVPIASVLLVLFSVVYCIDQNAKNSNRQIAIEKWKEQIVRPYIETLPKIHKEIIYIKITPEKDSFRKNEYFGESRYTSNSSIERTPLTVAYKDNGIVTSTDFYEIHAELSDHEKPYIEFQRLIQDLGNNVNSGKYNMKIYIPKSFKLNQDGIWLTSSNLIFS